MAVVDARIPRTTSLSAANVAGSNGTVNTGNIIYLTDSSGKSTYGTPSSPLSFSSYTISPLGMVNGGKTFVFTDNVNPPTFSTTHPNFLKGGGYPDCAISGAINVWKVECWSNTITLDFYGAFSVTGGGGCSGATSYLEPVVSNVVMPADWEEDTGQEITYDAIHPQAFAEDELLARVQFFASANEAELTDAYITANSVLPIADLTGSKGYIPATADVGKKLVARVKAICPPGPYNSDWVYSNISNDITAAAVWNPLSLGAKCLAWYDGTAADGIVTGVPSTDTAYKIVNKADISGDTDLIQATAANQFAGADNLATNKYLTADSNDRYLTGTSFAALAELVAPGGAHEFWTCWEVADGSVARDLILFYQGQLKVDTDVNDYAYATSTANNTGVSSLTPGAFIYFKGTYDGVSTSTLEIFNSSGTSLGSWSAANNAWSGGIGQVREMQVYPKATNGSKFRNLIITETLDAGETTSLATYQNAIASL